nr:PREDICTED: transcription initiation factor TFIID subunit 4-like [Equus przewalskii]
MASGAPGSWCCQPRSRPGSPPGAFPQRRLPPLSPCGPGRGAATSREEDTQLGSASLGTRVNAGGALAAAPPGGPWKTGQTEKRRGPGAARTARAGAAETQRRPGRGDPRLRASPASADPGARGRHGGGPRLLSLRTVESPGRWRER